MKEVDSDGSGDIDFHEFVTVMSRRVQADYTPEQLKVSMSLCMRCMYAAHHSVSVTNFCLSQAAFKVFETDNVPPGCVSTEVLEHALTTYGSDKLSPDEAAELLATVDPENTGKINYMEFINMMSTN